MLGHKERVVVEELLPTAQLKQLAMVLRVALLRSEADVEVGEVLVATQTLDDTLKVRRKLHQIKVYEKSNSTVAQPPTLGLSHFPPLGVQTTTSGYQKRTLLKN